MPRYFFDTRDGEKFICDDEGLEYDTIQEARDEATAGLADMAKDAIPGRVRRELAVEVRDAADVHFALVRGAGAGDVARVAASAIRCHVSAMLPCLGHAQ